MGRVMPPFYGEGLKFWSDELAKAIAADDTDKIQACLKSLAMFVKNESDN